MLREAVMTATMQNIVGLVGSLSVFVVVVWMILLALDAYDRPARREDDCE